MKNQRVFITGASSGIGAACARIYAKNGAKLVLCARRGDKLQKLQQELQDNFLAEVYLMKLDITDPDAVDRAFEALPEAWHDIDVLINNAGLALGLEPIYEGKISDWNTMIDTNVKGLLYISRHVLKFMKKNNRGYVVNLGSISSHQVYAGGTVYCATKYAEKAISEGMKMDVHGSAIRITSVDPGMVETEFSLTRFGGNQHKADVVYKGMTPLAADDVADAIFYCTTRPPHVNIRELKIYPTDQTAAHLCHRE